MPDVKFNRFYRYAELTRILKAYAREYPNLIRLEAIGTVKISNCLLVSCNAVSIVVS